MKFPSHRSRTTHSRPEIDIVQGLFVHLSTHPPPGVRTARAWLEKAWHLASKNLDLNHENPMTIVRKKMD